MSTIDPAAVAQVAELARAAGAASRSVGLLSRADKDAALLAMADALDAATADIIAANAEDLERPHGLNERISIENFERTIRFYIGLMEAGAMQ